MRKLLRSLAAAVGLAAALGAAPAPAAQIPLGIVGMNYGGDPTITTGFPYATGVYPNYTTFDRIYDSIRGATAHATWWSTLNPSAGTYTFTANLDPILAAEAARGKITEYTLSGVPSYVNASQKVSGGTQLTQFSTFLTAMMAHVAGNNQCFGYFSLWNEVNQPSTFWTGTAAEMAALSAAAYPIIKAACPDTIVLSASTTSGVDTGSSPNPNGPFQYLNAYLAACTSGCFDAVNVHGYPQVPTLQTADTSIFYAPELLANTITNAQSVAVANGFSSDIYLDEGYACSDPASTSFPANTRVYASCQATQLVIAAFNGVKSYANSFWGAGCTIPACGNEYFSGGPLKGTPTLVAKRNVASWLAGASTSGGFTRTGGANLITVAPNDASVATGNIGGLGVGCPSPPAGTGSLPVGASPWGLSATASIAGGMSYYVVGDGTSGGQPYIDVRLCGTDSSGANSDSVRMNNFSGAAVQGDNVVISACLGLAAGSLTGIQEVDLQVNEYASGPTYANQFMVQSQIQPVSTTLVPITSQCFQTRYVMKAATAAFAVPYILVKHYGSVAIDATIRIGRPRLDVNSTLWSGIITKAGGYSATIAEDASGSGSIAAPVGSVDYRDVFGGVYPTTGGATIHLTGSPILIENTAQTAYLPALTSGFFVAPSLGGNDGFAGTIAAPFATLNKCHTAMQASGTTRLCYIRGPVTAASWVQGSNEFWRNYPSDPTPAAITITGSTVQNIGCTSCSNIHVYGLTITGTGTGGNLFGYFGPSLSNIFIQDNVVSVTGNEQIGSIFNWSNFRIQGNTFTSPSTNGLDQFSIVINDSIAHDSLYVTDNTFNNLARIQLEILDLSSQTLTNVYVDRNVFQGTIAASGAIESVTVAGASTAAENHNSVYGNTITFPSNNNLALGGFEMAIGGVTVSNNELDYPAFPMSITGAAGSAYFNNTIKIPLSNTAAHNSGPASFSPAQPPFYQGLGWIGTNTIVGSGGSNSITDCSGFGTPPVSPGYCSILPQPIGGSPPTFWAPSPVWNQ